MTGQKGVMMCLWNPLAITVALVVILYYGTVSARTWTDSTGKHKVEGDFVSLADGKVELRRDDGKLIYVPLEKLSENDQAFVHQASRSAGNETPFSVAETGEAPITKSKPAASVSDVQNAQTVFAEGVGTSKEEALKDAFRAAVRQVVGEIVDSETLVNNEELVKDQVLTYSDGFIPEHKVTSEKHDNGLFRVSIQAKVQRRSVIMKLSAANITTKELAGQSMFGELATQLQAENDAAAIVRKALEGVPDMPGFPLNILTAEIVGKPEIVEKNAENATLAIRVATRVDVKSFDAFAKKLMNALDGVAKRKGEFSLRCRSWRSEQPPRGFGRESDYRQAAGFMVQGRVDELDPIRKKTLGTTWADIRIVPGWPVQDSRGGESPIALAINTTRDKSFEKTEWRYYVLDRSTLPVLAACACAVCELKLTLSDDGGNDVAVARRVLCGVGRGGTAICPLAFDGIDYDINFLAAGHPETSGMWAKGYESIVRPGARLGFLGPMFFVDRMTSYCPTIEHVFPVNLSHAEISRIAKGKVELRYEGNLPPSDEEIRAATTSR
jgi:hypothetical protein